MSYHKPVLVESVLDHLITDEGVYVDGTLGGGGHSEAILNELEKRNLLKGSRLYVLDKDNEAISYASAHLKKHHSFFFAVRSGFEAIESVMGGEPKVKGILLDLGISSHQIDVAYRGFSFQKDAPLDMRLSGEGEIPSAKEVLNKLSQEELKDIIKRYGEEPKANAITKAIISHREKVGTLETTGELANIVGRFYYTPKEKTKAKARVFQAIRIYVNKELDALKQFLNDVNKVLLPKGRLAIITYHSLEDRIVKQFFREVATDDWGPRELMTFEPIKKATFRQVTKRPVLPTNEEVEENPRSRSAKLRVIEKL